MWAQIENLVDRSSPRMGDHYVGAFVVFLDPIRIVENLETFRMQPTGSYL